MDCRLEARIRRSQYRLGMPTGRGLWAGEFKGPEVKKEQRIKASPLSGS